MHRKIVWVCETHRDLIKDQAIVRLNSFINFLLIFIYRCYSRILEIEDSRICVCRGMQRLQLVGLAVVVVFAVIFSIIFVVVQRLWRKSLYTQSCPQVATSCAWRQKLPWLCRCVVGFFAHYGEKLDAKDYNWLRWISVAVKCLMGI